MSVMAASLTADGDRTPVTTRAEASGAAGRESAAAAGADDAAIPPS